MQAYQPKSDDLTTALEIIMKAGEVSVWRYDIKERRFYAMLGDILMPDGTTYEQCAEAIAEQGRELYHAVFDDLISGRKDKEQTIFHFIHPQTGEDIFYRNSLAILFDAKGQRASIIGTQKDITHDIIREQQLEEFKIKTELINEKNNIIQWDYDVASQHIITHGNGAIQEGTMMDVGTYLSYVHPDERQSLGVIFEQMSRGELDNFDTIIRAYLPAHDDYRYLIINAIARRDKKGVVTSYTGIRRDATEEIMRNKELAERTYKTELVSRASGLMSWEYDCNRGVFISDDNALFGREMTMEDYLELASPYDREELNKIWNTMRECRDESFSIDLKFRLGGQWRYATVAGEPYEKDANGKVIRYLGYRNDTSDMAKMNINIRESKFKTDMAMKNANMVMWEYNTAEKMFTAFNDPLTAYDATAKYSPEEYMSVLDPSSIQEARKAVEFMNRQELGEFSFKSKILLPDSPHWQYVTIFGSHSEVSDDDSTKATKYIGFRVNNTEQVKLLQGLEESNTLMSSILAQGPSMVFIKDITNEWRYVIANDLFCQLFNYTGDQVIGYTDYEMFDKDVADKFRSDDLKAIGYDGAYSFIEEVITDGVVKALHTTKKVITMGNGRQLLIGITSDISDTLAQQHTLEETQKYLDLAINAGNVAVWGYDPKRDVVFNISGKVFREDVLPFEEATKYLHQDDLPVFAESWEKLCSGESDNETICLRFTSPFTGKMEYVDKSMTTLRTPSGELDMIIGTHHDVTADKMQKIALEQSKERAEEANALLHSIIKQIPFGLYIKEIDNDFRYAIMNDVLAKIDAIDSKDAIGKSDYELFDKEVADIFHRENVHVASLPDGELTVVKSRIDWHGQKNIYENSDTAITVAGRRLLIGVVSDITEKEHMLNELQVAKERAEQSDKLKSAFLANMSHEIRTPLNAIVGFSELLIEAEDAQQREEYTNIISVNNELLLRLIGDILDLSKIESGMIELKKELFDISEICDEVYMMLKQKVTNRKVKFVVENPYHSCMVELDRNRLKQVGINFITNAIKYTAEGEIKMGYEYVNNGIMIYVTDTGIGIAQENHDKVFERFEKFDTFAQGTGLGLSICKAIVEAQGGTIGFESEVDKGSRFWAWFPCSAQITQITDVVTDDDSSIANQESAAELHTSSNGDFRILIAEDNDSNYMLFSHILKEYDLTRAYNGAEAVLKAKEGEFDLILMDWKMPVMNGLDATIEIRNFDTKIPIVAVTANAFDANKVDILKAGCNAFVAKPLKKQELFDAINSCRIAAKK